MKTFILSVITILSSGYIYAGGGYNYIPPKCDTSFESDVNDFLGDQWTDYKCFVDKPALKNGVTLVNCVHKNGHVKVGNLEVSVVELAKQVNKRVQDNAIEEVQNDQLNEAIQWAVYENYKRPEKCLTVAELEKKDRQPVADKIEYLSFGPEKLSKMLHDQIMGERDHGKEVINGNRVFTGKDLESGDDVLIQIDTVSKR